MSMVSLFVTLSCYAHSSAEETNELIMKDFIQYSNNSRPIRMRKNPKSKNSVYQWKERNYKYRKISKSLNVIKKNICVLHNQRYL